MPRLENPSQLSVEENLRSLQLPSQLKVPKHRPSWLFRVKLLSDIVFKTRGGIIALFLAFMAILSGRSWPLLNTNINTSSALPAGETKQVKRIESTQVAVSTQAVTLHTAKRENVSTSLTLIGTVVPQSLVNVMPALNGLPIVEMRVDSGDRVSAGQVLAVLDTSVLQAQLRQAEANLTQAQTTVQQQDAALTEAQVLQQAALVDMNRYGSLFEAGAISQEQLGSRQVQALTARQQVQVANASLENAQANIDGKAAEIERIKALISQSIVTAPVSGTIAERFVTLGETASASTALYSLIEHNQLALELRTEQAQLSEIALGMPVMIDAVDGGASLALTGTVDEIKPLLDAQKRQAVVKVLLSELGDQLRAGMFLRATVQTDTRRNIVVPASAVVTQPDGQSVVFTLRDVVEGDAGDRTGTVKVNRVEVGARENSFSAQGLGQGLGQPEQDGYAEILSGLTVGDQVVVGGASYLQVGDDVSIVAEDMGI